jgi:hypothetical protein
MRLYSTYGLRGDGAKQVPLKLRQNRCFATVKKK